MFIFVLKIQEDSSHRKADGKKSGLMMQMHGLSFFRRKA